MGHTIQYYDYPENTDKKKVEQELANYVAKRCFQEGGHLSKIRWIDSEPCANDDEAHEKIERLDKGWYDCIAVKYYDAYNVPETEKMKALRAANTQAYCKYKELASAFHFANAKAEYIGCKNCGSKIARKYLRRNFCPVCNADLRPETTLNRIAALKEKADKSSDTLKAELTKQAMKAKNVRWKIKIEFHE